MCAGQLQSLRNVDWCYHVDDCGDSATLAVSVYGTGKHGEEGEQHHTESWQLNQPDPARLTAVGQVRHAGGFEVEIKN